MSYADTFSYKHIPIQEEGRIKPLDSFARNQLLRFNGKTSLTIHQNNEKLKLDAIDWLMSILTQDPSSLEIPIFKIENPDLVDVIKLNWREKYTYSYNEINDGLNYVDDKINNPELINTLIQRNRQEGEKLDLVDSLYKLIINAGTHKAESIKVAEAAKVIENTQRDLNIALINELAIIFEHLDIDTESVLKAAETKWNFLPFRPGLVGGHCIGVDPYYLTFKAQQIGYEPKIILSGRELNDEMSKFVSQQLLKKLNNMPSKILIMGLSFKENCPDIRNTKIIDIYNDLHAAGCDIDIYDPWISKEAAFNEFGIDVIDYPEKSKYDGILIAVGHNEFKSMGAPAIREFGNTKHILFDLKYIFNASDVDLRL